MLASFLLGATGPAVASLSPSSGEVTQAVDLIGANLLGATSVTFNGVPASFTVVDSGRITAIVPNGAGTGAVAVTTPSGTAVGPVFTVAANNFAFDLTTVAFPTGLTASRTGATMYPQRSATTAAAQSTPEVFENWGDARGGGHWTFAGYYNAAPAPFAFSSGNWDYNGTNPVYTANAELAPDGTMTADKLDDQSTSVAPLLSVSGSTAPATSVDVVASVWVKDVAGSAPTVPGGLSPRPDTGNPVGLGTGTLWRRLASRFPKNGGSSYEYCFVYPSGATPDAGGTLTLTPSSVGAVYLWGGQGARAWAHVPVADGTTSALTMAASTPANALAANGDMHVESAFLMDDLFFGGAIPGQPTYTILRIATPNGDQRVDFADQVMTWVLNGAAGNNRNIGLLDQAGEFRVEIYNRPSVGDAGANFWINGFRSNPSSVREPSATQGAPTAVQLGHNAGANILPRRHTLLRKVTRGVNDAEGVILGDSIISTYSPYSSPGTYIYTIPESRARDGIVSYAAPGNQFTDQTTAWNAATQKGQSYVKWVLIHCGINDLNSGAQTAAQTTARLQALITNINASNPTARILISPVMPALGSVGSTNWAKALVYNQNIHGTGPNPITGSNLVVLADWTNADAGNHGGTSGNLWSAYDSGDGIHQNTLARQYMAAAYRAALVAAGLL